MRETSFFSDIPLAELTQQCATLDIASLHISEKVELRGGD
jgi:hypothetical protein